MASANYRLKISTRRSNGLLKRIESYQQGGKLTRLVVLLTLYLFIRSSELRFTCWREIDFRNRIWGIPATRDVIAGVRYSGRRAKMRTPHIEPLVPTSHR